MNEEYALDNVVKIIDALNNTNEEKAFFKEISEIEGNGSQKFNIFKILKQIKIC